MRYKIFSFLYLAILSSGFAHAYIELADDFKNNIATEPQTHGMKILRDEFISACKNGKTKISFLTKSEAEELLNDIPEYKTNSTQFTFGNVKVLEDKKLLNGTSLNYKELKLYKQALFWLIQHYTMIIKNGISGLDEEVQSVFRSVDPHILKTFAKETFTRSVTGINQCCFDSIKTELAWQGKITYLDILEKTPKLKQEISSFFSHKNFGFASETDKNEFIKNNRFGFLEAQIIDNIYDIAKKILSKSKKEDTLVFFGNTPVFLSRAIEKILKGENLKIISFPFSGSPNRLRPGFSPTNKDYTTPSRLNYILDFLKKRGLSPENSDLDKGTVYIIDNIGSGGGPAFVLEHLCRSYLKKDKKIPNFTIMALAEIRPYIKSDKRIGSILKEGENKLHFPSIKQTYFTIDLVELNMENAGSIDNIQTHQRFYPSYNAQYWNKDYEFLLDQAHTPYMKMLIDYFDQQIDSRIKNDLNKSPK